MYNWIHRNLPPYSSTSIVVPMHTFDLRERSWSVIQIKYWRFNFRHMVVLYTSNVFLPVGYKVILLIKDSYHWKYLVWVPRKDFLSQ